jgi:hypothetical protein
MSNKARRLTDAEIREKLNSIVINLATEADLAAKVSGRLILLQAQIDMLEELFIASEVRRGLKEQKVRRALEKGKAILATSKLEEIGDASPQMAEEIDIQGLLKRALSELESDESS